MIKNIYANINIDIHLFFTRVIFIVLICTFNCQDNQNKHKLKTSGKNIND